MIFRRFDPQLNKMWHETRAGKIGPVRIIRSTNRDPPGLPNKEYLLASGITNIYYFTK